MRVFLVDDEFLQRALVKKTVDWNSLGMEICGEAEDGEIGISLQRSLKFLYLYATLALCGLLVDAH